MKPISYGGVCAYAMFCEDIRREAGGQFSIIGVFPNVIRVPALPVMIPKLAVFGVVRTAIDTPPKSLILRIEADWADHPFMQHNFEAELKQSRDLKTQDGSAFQASFTPIFAPFELPSTGKMRVVTVVDDVEIVAGSIVVELGAPRSPRRVESTVEVQRAMGNVTHAADRS